MANKNTIAIELIVNDNGTATIKSFGSATASELKKAEAAAGSLGAGFAKTWAGISAGAASVIYLYKEIASAVAAPIKAFMESESALFKLGMAMKNQGDYSRAALDDLVAYAEGLQKVTAYEDDLLLAMMGNLKSYGMTNEEVKRATKVAMDFATAKANEGMSITTASELIGKAYAGNTAMLGRYGIMIDDTIPKGAKFAAVLDQLGSRFGGSAQSELATYAGQWKHLQNIWGDIQEFLGLVLLKAIEGIMVGLGNLTSVSLTAVSAMLETFRAITSPITLLMEGFAKLAEIAGMPGTAEVLRSVAGAAKMAQDSVKQSRDVVNAWTATQYDAMVATEKVTDAIEKSGIVGKRTQAIDEEAAAKRKQATESIVEAIRKANIEINSVGKAQFEQDVARINSEAEKYRQAGVDKVLVAKFVATEMEVAHKKAYEEMAKAAREAADAAISEMEREIAMGVSLTDAHIKGAEAYRQIVAGEYEFAATENERAINKIIADASEKEIKLRDLLDKGYITFEQYETAKVGINANKNKAILENEVEGANKIAAAKYAMIQDIAGLETQAYTLRLAQIEAEKNKRIKDAGSTAQAIVFAEKWAAAETEKAFILMGKASNDWRTGVLAGLKEIEQANTTWGTVAYNTTKQTFDDMGKAFGSNFRDIIKGDFKNLDEAWDRVWEGMLGTLTDTLGKMVAEAISKDIAMMFKADWTADSSAVLGLLKGAWNLASSFFSSEDGLATGGDIPVGKPVWVGEKGRELLFSTRPGYVMNHQESMSYAAQYGGHIRGLATGGAVDYTGAENWDDAASLARSRGRRFKYDPGLDKDVEALLAWYNTYMNKGANLPEAWSTNESGYGITQWGSPVNYDDPLADVLLQMQTGENMMRTFFRDGSWEDQQIVPEHNANFWSNGTWFKTIVGAACIAAITYVTGGLASGVSSSILGGALSAAGAGAGAGLVTLAMTGGDWMSALTAFITAAAMSYVSSYISELNAPAEGAESWMTTEQQANWIKTNGGQESWSSGIYTKVLNYAEKWLAKNGIKWVLNQITGGLGLKQGYGNARFSQDSVEDGGLSGMLAGWMGDLAPKQTPFAFHARNGLDYVPYDGMPIIAHKGEAVITERENKQRMSGGRGDIVLNFNFPNALVVDKRSVSEFAEAIYPRLKQLEAWGH